MVIGNLTFQLNRKEIKNLHISVLPPDGFVRVSAPEKMTETAIRMAVISRIPWIKKQQQEFLKLAQKIPLTQWDNAKNILLVAFNNLVSLLKD